MISSGLPASGLFQKHQEEHPEGVKRGQEGRDGGQGPVNLVVDPGVQERRQQDAVLAEKAAHQGKGAQGQGPDEKGPVDLGKQTPQVAHFENVMLFVQGLNDVTRGQEQQGFEKSMGEQMEHAADDIRGAHGQHHDSRPG